MSEPGTQSSSDPTVSASSFLGHAKIIGGLTFVSRIAGLAREVVAGHYLGTGLVASAFTVAFTVPNLFRKLFGEGALSAAFIPLYAQAVKRKEQPAEFAVASINLLVALLLCITIVGELLLLGWLLLDRQMRVDTALTIKLTMIMLPYVLLICGGALLGGMLQVHKRFAAPAFAPVLLNLVHIAVVFIGAWIIGLHGNAPASERVIEQQARLAYWLAAFVLVAGALQVAVLVPGLRASGFRFTFVRNFWTPAVRQMIQLTIPVAISAGVLQLSVLMDKGISVALMQGVDALGQRITHFEFFGNIVRYPMELGAPARLNLAQFLYQFPLGIFAIALATAIFPGLSAAAADADRTQFKSTLRHGVLATLWEGLPASVGLIMVAEPAVRLLFQHGQITAHDATLITRSVMWYSGAIWAFGLLQIVNRAYYSLHDTRTPLVMSVVNIVLNLAVELPLIWTRLGEAGMAVGTLVSFTIQSLLMLWMLDRRVSGMGLREIATPIFKMLLATVVMAVVLAITKMLPFYPTGSSRTIWSFQLILLMVLGAGTYFFTCRLLGINMLQEMLPRRLRRGKVG